MIPYGRQSIDDADIAEVVSVLKSDYLTQGPRVPEFELKIGEYCGGQHVIAVNSATSALHIACLALGLGKGDRLWTSPITFLASANCGLYCGAIVEFVDIDPETYNLCPKKLEEKLRKSKEDGGLPKIVVAVHFAGQSCDMAAIHKLSEEFGFKVVEDASHAIGGKYLDQFVGSCQFSDVTIFSFHPVKIITTCEGGCAVTNSQMLASKMRLLRSHGMTRNPEQMLNQPEGEWYYEQIELGYNYRMTDLEAVLGTSQLTKIDMFVEHRQRIAQTYSSELEGLDITLPFQSRDCHSAYHLYPILINSGREGRKRAFNELRSQGIGVNVHYIPVHQQPYFANLSADYGDLSNSEYYYDRTLSLPIYSSLSEGDQGYVLKCLKNLLSKSL